MNNTVKTANITDLLSFSTLSSLEKISLLYPSSDTMINFRPYFTIMGNNLIENKERINLPSHPSSVSNTFIIPTNDIISASYGPNYTFGVDENHNVFGWGQGDKECFIPKGSFYEVLKNNKIAISFVEPILNVACNHLMNIAIGISGAVYWWKRGINLQSIYNFKNQLVDAKLIGQNIIVHLTDRSLYLIETETGEITNLFPDKKVLDFMTYNGLENIVFTTLDGKLYVDNVLHQTNGRVKIIAEGTTRNNEICAILHNNEKVYVQLKRKFLVNKNNITI